jgi:hypothetical protein
MEDRGEVKAVVKMDHLAGGAADRGSVGGASCQMVWQRPEREHGGA